jgi:hypothetical protein
MEMEVDEQTPDTSGTSTPLVESDNKTGVNKRFDFLLKQTELFAHFMGSNKATSPLKVGNEV